MTREARSLKHPDLSATPRGGRQGFGVKVLRNVNAPDQSGWGEVS